MQGVLLHQRRQTMLGTRALLHPISISLGGCGRARSSERAKNTRQTKPDQALSPCFRPLFCPVDNGICRELHSFAIQVDP